jgi:RNA polymerase sigma-70 factor (sigma-E family)
MRTGAGGVSEPSFDEYVRARGPALVRYAFLLTADWGLAEDMVQEALAAAHSKWRRIEKMDYPDAYVKQAVTRRFLSWRRRKSNGERPAGLLPNEAAPPAPGPSAAEGVGDRDEMWTALGTLPRQQRAVLVLRYYEDLPDERIAEVLGCSQSTVRVHAGRGLATMRQHAPAELRPRRQP